MVSATPKLSAVWQGSVGARKLSINSTWRTSGVCQTAAKMGLAFPPLISAHGPSPPKSATCARQASTGPAPKAAIQQPSESRMWTGNCLRDCAERSANEARAAYLARASTWVIASLLPLNRLPCQGDENSHFEHRADHA